MEEQPYWGPYNCRCIIENAWDMGILIIVVGLAMIGTLSIVDEIVKLNLKNRKK